MNGDKKSVRVDVADIVSVSACADLTLPPGAGLCIDTVHGPVYLVRVIDICFTICLVQGIWRAMEGREKFNVLDLKKKN